MLLPALPADFSRAYSAIHLQVFSENAEHVAEDVANGRFGFGLIEGPPKRRDVKVQPWFDDELLLLVPAGHEWAGLGTIAAEALVGVPLVVRELGSGSLHVLENGLQKAGIRLGSLRIVMELDSREAILSCIEAGLGIGFASEWAGPQSRGADCDLTPEHRQNQPDVLPRFRPGTRAPAVGDGASAFSPRSCPIQVEPACS